MRRSSALVPTDSLGWVLLQHRTEDAPTWPGYWGLFGGGAEEGETPSEALVREVREETGFDASGATEAGVVSYEGFTSGNLRMTVFHAFVEMKDIQAMASALTEGQGLGLFPVEELRGMKVVPHDMAAVERVVEWVRSRAPSSP